MQYHISEHIANHILRAFWAIGGSSLLLSFIFFLEILYRGLPRPTFLYAIEILVSLVLFFSVWLLPVDRLSDILISSRFKMRVSALSLFVLSPFWFWSLQFANEPFFTLGLIAYFFFFVEIQREICAFLKHFAREGLFRRGLSSFLKSLNFVLLILIIICMFQTLFSPSFFHYFYTKISHDLMATLLILPVINSILLFTVSFDQALKGLIYSKNSEKHI